MCSLNSKSGYDRAFQVGASPAAVNPVVSSGTSLASYAYLASPVSNGQTGVRGFGGDSSGVLCFTPDGSEPAAVLGVLPIAGNGCQVLN
jgi:hypothetical protein